MENNSVLRTVLPFLRWLPRVTKETIKLDFWAGFTGAVVVLPQGVAFAVIAGMPPVYGLYTAMVPVIVAAAFGSSWHLMSGPTTAASIMIFTFLSTLAAPSSDAYITLAITLTFLVGISQFVLGFAKLGNLVYFISHSVVIGFTSGAAMLIAVKQITNFFGVPMPRGLRFYEILGYFFHRLDTINPYVTTVAVVTLLAGIYVKRKFPKVPFMVASMVVGSLTAIFLDFLFGSDKTGITTVGALPATLPPFSLPDFSIKTISKLAPAVLATTLLTLTEAVSIARSLAVKSGQNIDGNQEFIGQGLSNIVGSFFSCFVATGSFNRSGVNYAAKAQTPLSAVFSGCILMVMVLFLAPLASNLPYAGMAGVLFLVAYGLIDFTHIKLIFRASRGEAVVLTLTFLTTLFLSLEFAILAGVILSFLYYLSKTSRPVITEVVPDKGSQGRHFLARRKKPGCPQLWIVRIYGSLFFGATEHARVQLDEIFNSHPGPKFLLIDVAGVNFVDLAGAEFLANKARELRRDGGGLFLCHAKPGLLTPLRRSGYIDQVGENHIFDKQAVAVSQIWANYLDKSTCRLCDNEVFIECADTVHKPL